MPTRKELDELATLKQRIFGDDIFLVVTPEIEKHEDYQRYDELVRKLQRWLAYEQSATIKN